MADKKPWEEYEEASGPWAEYQATSPEEEKGLLKEIGTAAIKSITPAGAIIGSAPGVLSANPLAAFKGAAWGGALAKPIQTAAESYFLDEPKTLEQVYTSPAYGALEGASQEIGGQLAQKATSGLVGLGGKLLKRTASQLSQVPEGAMETYLKNPNVIEKQIAEGGEDFIEGANKIRSSIMGKIKEFKSIQNDAIAKALENNGRTVDVSKGYDALIKFRDSMSAPYNPEIINAIDQEIARIELNSFVDAHGRRLNYVKDAFGLQQRLQDLASYESSGKIFAKGTKAEKAARIGAKNIRSAVNDAAPEIKEANNKLAELHSHEDNLNSNILGIGKSEAGLAGAGNKTNSQARHALSKISDLIGEDLVTPAEEFGAARTFSQAGLLPRVGTGAVLGPISTATAGALAGGTVGGYSGGERGAVEGASKGALLGLLGSPLAIRGALRGANLLNRYTPMSAGQMANIGARGLLRKD